jgi:type II secretory pathway component GspD/PulD (secretin)
MMPGPLTSRCIRRVLLLWFGALWIGAAALGQVMPAGQGGTRPGQRLPAGMQPNVPKEPSSVSLRLEGQEVVGRIRNAPLQQVLEELAAWSGIVFEIDALENPEITITFYRVPLLEAIQRLTADNNSIVYTEADVAGQNQIKLVRIFTRTPRPVPPSLHYIGTGSITKRSDDIVDSPEQAVAVLAGSSSLAARQKAIEVLVASKGAPAIQALKAVLTDPAVEIKVAAIEGLYALDAHDALPLILRALKDAHPGVRHSAVTAVGLLGDAKNVNDLRPLLKDLDGTVAAAANAAIQKLSARYP